MDETNPGPSELERIAERYAAKKVAERTAEIVAWLRTPEWNTDLDGWLSETIATAIEEKYRGK